MNFLSHYYFERNNGSAYEVLGCLLPDLLKNTDKDWKLHPDKSLPFGYSSAGLGLLKGWNRHLAVDRLFHNTAFFFYHQHALKKTITDIFTGTAIKPFFVGHIGLELCLDHLLISERKININQLYQHLNTIDNSEVAEFLFKNSIPNPEKFSTYFNNFRKEQYLHSYAEIDNLSYAVKRICMRIWEKPLTDEQTDKLTKAFSAYISHLKENFMIIFEDIESHILNG